MFANKSWGLLAVVILACICPSGVLAAANNAKYTSIVVTDMHCSTCAKKIAAKLYVVPGVLEVRADVKIDTAYVVPQKSKQPSARAMWEAVEAAGFQPVKLIGPAGKFTKKPAR